MEIIARQLTIDFYNCSTKLLDDIDALKNVLRNSINNPPDLQSAVIADGHISIIGAFADGHIAVHVYTELKYAAVDIFTCSEDTDPEILSKELRKFLKPDKIKSTFLKRGDFGQQKDMKPKIKTRVAPLRKIKSTGAKVIKKLVARDNR